MRIPRESYTASGRSVRILALLLYCKLGADVTQYISTKKGPMYLWMEVVFIITLNMFFAIYIGISILVLNVVAQPSSSNSTLAGRGAGFAALPDQRQGLELLFSSFWDPVTNPTGIVNFGTAENVRLLSEHQKYDH